MAKEEYFAIQYFEDTEDEKTPYEFGTVFPREGHEPSEERFEELSTNKNKQGRPVIAKLKRLDPKPSEQEILEDKTKDDLKALADEKGLEYDAKATKADLVSLLQEK